MGQGVERIEREDELSAVRAQARRVLWKSLGASGLVLGIFLVLLVV